MGECGCHSCCDTYKLPIDKDACYIIELYPGCKDCVAPPSVIIRRIDRGSVYWEEQEIMGVREMRLTDIDGCKEACIVCGLDRDEFRKEAGEVIIGTDVSDEDMGGKLDEALSDILMEDVWNEVIQRSPVLMEYEDRK